MLGIKFCPVATKEEDPKSNEMIGVCKNHAWCRGNKTEKSFLLFSKIKSSSQPMKQAGGDTKRSTSSDITKLACGII